MGRFEWPPVVRPMIPVTLCCGVGILLASCCKLSMTLLLLSAAALLVFGFLAAAIKPKWSVPVVLLMLCLLGAVRFNQANAVPTAWTEAFGEEKVLVGVIQEVTVHGGSSVQYLMTDMTIDGQPVPGRLIAWAWPEASEAAVLRPGDAVSVKTRVQQPESKRNPRAFDYRRYLLRQKIYAEIEATSLDYKKVGEGLLRPFEGLLGEAGRYVESVFERFVGGEEAELLKGMLLGSRQTLSPETEDNFERTGIAHILAISGLHVGFLAAALLLILSAAKAGPKTSFFCLLPILAVYCLLTGARPSTVRAVIMALIFLGGRCVGRRADAINSISCAAFLILLFRPLDLFDAGFQLSFAAVTGIALFYLPIKNRLSGFPMLLADGIAVMLSAQIGTSPVLAYHFNAFSIMAFAANIPCVFIAGIVVTLAFALLPLSVLTPAAVLLGAVIKALAMLMLRLSTLMARPSWASVTMVSPSLWLIAAYAAFVWVISYECPKRLVKYRLRAAAIVVAAALIINVLMPILDRRLKVTVLDIGQGDAIFIRTPDRYTMLIDCGGMEEWYEGSREPGSDVVVPFLLKSGIRKIDLLVLTHPHADHIGGAAAVLRSIDVKNVIVAEREWYAALLEGYEGNVIEVGKGDRITTRASVIEVLWPDSSRIGSGENNDSIVLRVTANDTAVLLTGDIEADAVRSVLEYVPTANLIKVPHHGGKGSFVDAYFDALNADYAVVSCGVDNRYGHPDPSISSAYANAGCRLFRTDLEGAVRFFVRVMGKMRIKTMLSMQPLRGVDAAGADRTACIYVNDARELTA